MYFGHTICHAPKRPYPLLTTMPKQPVVDHIIVIAMLIHGVKLQKKSTARNQSRHMLHQTKRRWPSFETSVAATNRWRIDVSLWSRAEHINYCALSKWRIHEILKTTSIYDSEVMKAIDSLLFGMPTHDYCSNPLDGTIVRHLVLVFHLDQQLNWRNTTSH